VEIIADGLVADCFDAIETKNRAMAIAPDQAPPIQIKTTEELICDDAKSTATI
jgi:hypothetical protein